MMEGDTQSRYHSSECPRPIIPAKNKKAPVVSDDDSPSHDEQKRTTKAACVACRKRKSKCSGARPKCAMCETRVSNCVYDTAVSDETHGQALKRKYEQLQESNTACKEILKFLQVRSDTEAEELFRHIRSGTDVESLMSYINEADILIKAPPTPNKWLQPVLPSITELTASIQHPGNPYFHSKLYKWSRPHDDDSEGPDNDVGDGVGPSHTTHPHRASYEQSFTTENEESIFPACFDQLLLWNSISIFSDSDLLDENHNQSTILSLPPLPLDAYTYHSHPDLWTQTGWTRAHINHLFDALFTWDYLPFSLICYDLFLQDFHTGSPQFCSSALVYAILALSARIVNENNDNSKVLPSGWLRSRVLFNEAKANIQNGGPFKNLPDIQALGLLSLYEIRFGQEVKAQELSEAFVYNITEFCQRQPPAGKEIDQDEQYARVKATTYCGAVSLARMLLLTTGRLFIGGDNMIQQDLHILDQLSQSREDASQSSNRFRSNLDANPARSELLDLQAISMKIFQLTEWVYKFSFLARPDSQRGGSDFEQFYNQCLNWYEQVFALLHDKGARTPFVLFVHMYYHFCLLSALKPFVNLAKNDSDIQPRKICRQAAQSILALAQSYDDLFTLQRVSGPIPYFVYAAGLFCIATEGSSSHNAPVHLRLSNHVPGTFADFDEHPSAIKQDDSLATSPFFKVSATVHARQLLAKMGSTHPAAAIARKKL